MFAFFPESYPDETIYSLISRYLEMEGIKFVKFQWILNDRVAPTTMHVLPVSLDRLAAKLPYQWNKSAETMLNEHTVFPYYSPFNSRARVARWTQQALREGPLAAAIVGYWKRSAPLRFCPKCVLQDLAAGCEPYFRCKHHIIGSPACAEHGLLLENIMVRGALPFIPLARIPAIETREGKLAPWKLVRLAHDIEYCATRWKTRNTAQVFKAIESQFSSLGSLRLGVLSQGDRALATYVSDVAHYLPPIFPSGNPLKGVVAGNKKFAGQPYHILLSIRAIGINPKTLFLFKDEKKKSRRSWCVNPSCKNYHQVVPVRFEVHEPAWQQYVAVRCLGCGLAYAAEKTKLFAKLPPRQPCITDFGQRLNEEFKAYWINPKMSYQDIAKIMGFSASSSVFFYAARAHNLPLDRNGASHGPPSRLLTLTKIWKKQRAKIEAGRQALRQLKDQIPTLTATQARTLNPKACNKIFPHDFIWWANLFGIPDDRRHHPLIERLNKETGEPSASSICFQNKL